jgi:hypothetical protein
MQVYRVQRRTCHNTPMGKSTRKLFVSAVISGISLSLGLPGLADLIVLAWDTTRVPLSVVTPRSILSLMSFVVFLAIMYLTFDIYLKGARKGTRGLRIVLAGVICGLVIGSLILVRVTQLTPV